MKSSSKIEVLIISLLLIISLVGILFAVKTSRGTVEEIIPQEGTMINNEVVESETETETVETETETAVESVESETEETETETVETETVETETVETETETETEVEVETTFRDAEPLSEKDLNFSFFGYDNYIEYIKAGNDCTVYMMDDNADMVVSGDFVNEGDVVESTVRGIKIGDSLDKIFKVYGNADEYDKYGRKCFSHDGLEDVEQYSYFLKIDETKDCFYSFRFIVDQYKNLIGFMIEPRDIIYWPK